MPNLMTTPASGDSVRPPERFRRRQWPRRSSAPELRALFMAGAVVLVRPSVWARVYAEWPSVSRMTARSAVSRSASAGSRCEPLSSRWVESVPAVWAARCHSDWSRSGAADTTGVVCVAGHDLSPSPVPRVRRANGGHRRVRPRRRPAGILVVGELPVLEAASGYAEYRHRPWRAC
jgi:hypothetical protein